MNLRSIASLTLATLLIVAGDAGAPVFTAASTLENRDDLVLVDGEDDHSPENVDNSEEHVEDAETWQPLATEPPDDDPNSSAHNLPGQPDEEALGSPGEQTTDTPRETQDSELYGVEPVGEEAGEAQVAGFIFAETQVAPLLSAPSILRSSKNIGFGMRSVAFDAPLSESEARKVVDQLLFDNVITWAELDYIIEGLPFSPPAPLSHSAQLTSQSNPGWGLDRIDQRALPLDNRFSHVSRGVGVPIYIVDSGIRRDHSEFNNAPGRILAGRNFHPGFSESDTSDCNGHGTHVAGISSGAFYGVAKLSTIVPLKAFDCSGQAPLSSVIAALDWIAKNHNYSGKTGVINLSLGTQCSLQNCLGQTILNDVVDQMTLSGFVVVAASGNDGLNSCFYTPASARTAITVNASTPSDTRASFSNAGSCSDIYAPGIDIVTAGVQSASGLVQASGSSFAAPFVAGTIALLIDHEPNLSSREIRNLLLSLGSPFSSGVAGDATRLLFTGVNPAGVTSQKNTPENFVRLAYSDFLDRPATNAEVQFWASEIRAGRATQASLAQTLSQSDEWIRTVIRRFYLDTLGREPDPAGYQFWITQARMGMPVADIGAFFYGSDEYFRGFGRGSNEVWIRDLYNKLMLRQADAAGLQFWMTELQSGRKNRSEVARWFYDSPEKRLLRVDALYFQFLKRPPDSGGRSFWAGRILTNGDLALASDLASSPEYYGRTYYPGYG